MLKDAYWTLVNNDGELALVDNEGRHTLPVWQVASRDEAPESVKGGFNTSFEVYSVARKGRLTLIGRSEDATWADDNPSQCVAVPSWAKRVVILFKKYGNGGYASARLYQ